jgi:hypothetical protein
MATHERYNIPVFWDDEFKKLNYISEPFNDPIDVGTWIGQGYQSKICGDLCDMRHTLPSWNDRVIEHFTINGWRDIGCAYYRMGTGTVMPEHQDRYVRYINLFKLRGQEFRIRRALVMLEDWKSGHYLEIQGKPVVEWKAGDVIEWVYDTPHMAANLGLENRYSLQITGWVPTHQIVGIDGEIVEFSGDEIVCSPHRADDSIFEWCNEHEVSADLIWSGSRENGVRSEWGIKDDEQRLFFSLRWL